MARALCFGGLTLGDFLFLSKQAVPVERRRIEKKDSLNVPPRRYLASLGLWPKAKADSIVL